MSKTTRMKKALLIIVILVVVAGGYGIYLFNMRPPDIRKKSPDYELTVDSLVSKFEKDEDATTKAMAGKVILVSGKVVGIKLQGMEPSVMLGSADPLVGVTCTFYPEEKPNLESITVGMMIRVKGKCTGKLIDVVMNNCSLASHDQ